MASISIDQILDVDGNIMAYFSSSQQFFKRKDKLRKNWVKTVKCAVNNDIFKFH